MCMLIFRIAQNISNPQTLWPNNQVLWPCQKYSELKKHVWAQTQSTSGVAECNLFEGPALNFKWSFWTWSMIFLHTVGLYSHSSYLFILYKESYILYMGQNRKVFKDLGTGVRLLLIIGSNQSVTLSDEIKRCMYYDNSFDGSASNH